MIATGGENVYSIEVENAIGTHPAVKQVAVVGEPDEIWGELARLTDPRRPRSVIRLG